MYEKRDDVAHVADRLVVGGRSIAAEHVQRIDAVAERVHALQDRFDGGAGIVALDITGYGSWSVTDAGRRVLKGADKVTLRQDTLKPATKKAKRSAANATALAEGGRYRPIVWGRPPQYPWGYPRMPRPNELVSGK